MKQYKLIVKLLTRTRSTAENRAREMNLWDLYGLTALSLGLHTHTHTHTHTGIVQDWIATVELGVAAQDKMFLGVTGVVHDIRMINE